jgi:hypothetical protein
MTFTFSQLPIGTPEQTSPWGNMMANAMKQYQLGIQTEYSRPNAIADLLKKQQYNEMYKPDIKSQIGLRGAQSGLLGEQSKYYGPNINSEIGLRKAQEGLYGNQSLESAARARKLQMMTDYLSGNDNQNNHPATQMEQNPNYQMNGSGMFSGNGQQQQSQQPMPQQSTQPVMQNPAPYGIQTPKPTREDIMNKMVFGMDTFGKNQEQAFNQQNDQRKTYMEKTLASNIAAQSATKTDQLLDQYNYAMDHAFASGPLGKYLPKRGAAQEVDQITAQLLPEAVKGLRAAMKAGQFTNKDMGLIEGTTPQRSWTPEARRFYTDSAKAFNQRIQEKAKFDQVTSNPQMGIPSHVADAMWRSYQAHHPIVQSASTKTLNEYRKDNWMKYLTPKAIKSIVEKGDYDPKDKGLVGKINDDIKKIIKETSAEDAKKELERRRSEKKK